MKSVLVTGGTARLGRAISDRLRADGWQVVTSSHRGGAGADIVSGMGEGAGRYEVVSDRRSAIARAIQIAEPGDAVLVAGKGHEDYQIVGDTVLDFDDRKVAAEELDRAFS